MPLLDHLRLWERGVGTKSLVVAEVLQRQRHVVILYVLASARVRSLPRLALLQGTTVRGAQVTLGRELLEEALKKTPHDALSALSV